MKKINTTKLMALLAALCLITSCFAGSTLAKYVTTGDGSDQARVAKWGVTISTDGTMFSDSYKNDPTDYTADEEVDTITVQASAATTESVNNNVVAPGTQGVLAAYDIAGTPEVDTEVTYTAALTLTGWEVDGAEYCPIEITVNGTKYTQTGTIDDFEENVEAAIVAATAKYHTNQDLSVVEDDLVVSWAWPFYVDDATDVKDTALGDAAAAGNAATIQLDTSCTITQVD